MSLEKRLRADAEADARGASSLDVAAFISRTLAALGIVTKAADPGTAQPAARSCPFPVPAATSTGDDGPMAHEPLAAASLPCPDGCADPLSVHSADLGCWLCDCLYGRTVPGLTSAVSPGQFEPITLDAAGVRPGQVPDGTTASRCRGCGETRLHYPADPRDPWKKHLDYCGGGQYPAGSGDILGEAAQ